MATRLFVGNLPQNTQENDLQQVFSPFGEITNLDLKNKPGADESKKFAFVTLSASNYDIESCIKHFTNEDFKGSRLYVTRARESFLERLQREREQAHNKESEKLANGDTHLPKKPIINLGDKLNPRQKRFDKHSETAVIIPKQVHNETFDRNEAKEEVKVFDKKKIDSEQKRLESLKKKRQEFQQKKNIIKTGLTGIDQVKNKKIVFSEDDTDSPKTKGHIETLEPRRKNTLFDDADEDSGDEVNFEIKQQFEGRKGQKVLDLQSRYKSDKRFVLDERFIEDEEANQQEDQIELEQADEKTKQLDILQNVLGVTLKRKLPHDEKDSKKSKPKIGMLRFDPMQPEHAKFLAPVEETKPDPLKKSKKKNKNKEEIVTDEPKVEENRPEVSKEQFYKISETLKEAIVQPTQFSLRSLFGNEDKDEEEPKTEEDAGYISLDTKKTSKVKNPLDPGDKNPFVYDSSESEAEDVEQQTPVDVVENKAVWKESLFFRADDQRLKDGLSFFMSTKETETQKERRELKSIMKKRIYNNERKNQMFRKKIGGRKKTMKKSFNKRS